MTNFGCRLAKHRGGDTLEVRDLQLHLGKYQCHAMCPSYTDFWPSLFSPQSATTISESLALHQTRLEYRYHNLLSPPLPGVVVHRVKKEYRTLKLHYEVNASRRWLRQRRKQNSCRPTYRLMYDSNLFLYE